MTEDAADAPRVVKLDYYLWCMAPVSSNRSSTAPCGRRTMFLVDGEPQCFQHRLARR